jgi:hypothetical protein
MQLVYFRGNSECGASPWLKDTATLLAMMRKIECSTGLTQIGRVLAQALKETTAQRVRGVVYVRDAFEEALGDVKHDARALGAKETPVFMFQEGEDDKVAKAYMEIAHLTGCVYARFDASFIDQAEGPSRGDYENGRTVCGERRRHQDRNRPCASDTIE